MNRFNYVKYDDEAIETQNFFKIHFMSLEKSTNEKLKSPRAKALVRTKLEEAYMWIGKAIRDDQIQRGGTYELEGGRGDS